MVVGIVVSIVVETVEGMVVKIVFGIVVCIFVGIVADIVLVWLLELLYDEIFYFIIMEYNYLPEVMLEEFFHLSLT